MRNQMSTVLLTAFVAVLGVAALAPRPSGEGPPEAKRAPAAAPPARPDEGSREPPEEQPGTDFLKPLEEFVGKSIRVQGDRPYRIPDEYQVEPLIALIHDPLDSSSGYRFDTITNAIQRALEREQFVLDRFWFPWQTKAGAAAPAEDAWQVTSDLLPSPGTGSPSAPRPGLRIEREKPQDRSLPYERQPGVLLFRRGQDPKGEAPGQQGCPGQTHLLMVFLVGDTATKGLQKKALETSLQFIRDADLVPPTEPIRILGPAFSGSQTSLGIVLRDWATSGGKGYERRIRVVSGTATALKQDLFKGDCAPLKVDVGATVVPEDIVIHELLAYARPKTTVALLRETNTGFGQSAWGPHEQAEPEQAEPTNPRIIEIPFPMHIAEVRTAYAKDPGGKAGGLPSLPSFVGRLRIPFEEGRQPRDTEPTLSPGMTATYSERVLGTILSTIARERIQYVAILATDVKDMIFLATVIRQSAPDVQLLFSHSDALLSHPDYRYALRGALVGSTYPLYSNNQRWSYPFHGQDSRSVFPSQIEQGYYNAVIALREGGAGKPGERQVWPQALLEYGPPFQVPPAGEARPPVWISILGEDGPHPLASGQPSKNDGARYKSYVVPATNCPAEPDGFEFRHTRLWVWALVTLMAFLGLLAALYWYGGLGGPRDEGGRSGLLFVELWQPRRPDLRRRQELYSLACFAPATAFWGYVTAISLIPYLAAWTWRPGGEIRLYYFPIPVLAPLTFAVLLAVSVAAVCRALLAPPTAAEGEARGAGRYFVPAALLALALWVAGRLVYHAAIGLYRPASFPPFRESALFFFERVTNVADGVSPVLPAFFLTLALFWWGLTQLKRLNRLERATPPGADPGDPPAGPPDMPTRLRTCASQVWEIVRSPHALGPFRPALLVVWAGLAFAFCRLHSGFIPTAEGTLFDSAVQFAFAAVSVLLVFTFLHTLELWHRLRRLLLLVAQLPLLQAFDRMPARVPSLFGPYLSSSSSDRESHLVIRAQQLRALAEQYARARDRLSRLFGGPGPLADLDEAMGYDALAVWRQTEQWLHKHGAGAGQTAEELSRSREEAEAAVVRERVQKFLGPDQPLPELCRKAARACVAAIDRAWPTLSVGDAFAHAPAAAAGEGAASAPAPAGGGGPAPDDPLRQWFRLAEDFLAIEVVNWLSHFFAQLRNLITFLVVGSILLLFAVLYYPFQPQRLLLIFTGGLILVFAVGLFRMFLQIERDEVVSRILKTTPNRINLNPVFLSHVGTYVVPLLGVLAATSMDVSNLLHTLLDPLYQALK
jgi:hypothetical protein